MILNSIEIFEAKRVENGDRDAVFRLLKIYTERKDWDKCAEYALMVMDEGPEYCERKMLEHVGEPIKYEDMIGIIAIYYDEMLDFEMTCKWVQKYSDYIDYAKAHLTQSERTEIKESFAVYNFVKEEGELNKTEHRFMFKWEERLFLQAIKRRQKQAQVTVAEKIQPVAKENSFLSAVRRFIRRVKTTLAL